MKALVLEAYNKFNFQEVEIPEIKTNEVLVKVKACGICGSDVHGMDGSTGRRIPPLIMGHEASGIIEKVGGNVKNWNKGDRVTFDSTVYPLNDWFTLKGLYNLSDNRKVLGVSPEEYKLQGAMAEYVVIPEHILYKIPDNVSFEQAAMVEPVAVAAHALSLADIKVGDSAVVVGTGMIGIFIVELLKIAGVSPVIAVDIDDKKLESAFDSGADFVINIKSEDAVSQIFELTGRRGADLAFEVVGIEPTVNFAIQSLRKGGQVTLVGNLSKEVNFPLQKVVTQQLKVQGSCAINGEYEKVLNLFSSGKIKPEKMVSAVVPLSEGAHWFNRLYNKESGLNKVILVP